MRSFTVDERRNRLARRHFLTPDTAGESIAQIAATLIGLHGTDPATPYLSLWARSSPFAVADLNDALYEKRSLVKHLAMRRTLWVIDPADLPAVQAAASDRVAGAERRKLIADVGKAGVAEDGEHWLARAGDAVLRHLGEHGPTSSAALRSALPELAGTYDPAPGKSYGGQTHLAPRALTVLGAQGDIVRGPNDGGWTSSRPRWATATDWLGEPGEPMSTEAAQAQLVGTWLRAFGPTTAEDITWWFGTTKTAIRKALRDIGVVDVDLHGTPGYALPDDLEPEPDVEEWGALLPGLDVTTMGWYHRDWYLGAHRGQLFDNNGNAGPTAWWNGRIVGGWCQDAAAKVRVQFLEDPGRVARDALTRRARELTDWLDGVRVPPRFPSPLVKAAPH
ncbi:winged helix DNA-binding domain-containing protein [Mycolicibacter sp. MYC123]|uniref:Winged helix DNA-binding domain-containing protein n=1 Tax=[Mycobacterium] zoologicum TaxID=2872311 RepID=A0ABU5YKL3_9MYCO|nr:MULTISPECIES: winged helix DNA-binding domain-containing protein [unclassified Mycolicibacter]MEB3050596.1 winged helix DNA-binding domain-containing protein [Mycolicibacter sp. MYC123]MEB3063365.1 winged helix DNA-binding domain-containing protein [Mycolicibacter sp. MYC101]